MDQIPVYLTKNRIKVLGERGPDGRTMVHVRVLEHFGIPVIYDETTDSVYAGCEPPVPEKPKLPLQGKIIVVDPGHGGKDPGAVDGINLTEGDHLNTREAELNLEYALELKKKLEALGATVYLTRTGNTFVDLFARSRMAEVVKAHLFVSIHMNSALDPKANGREVLASGSAASAKMADLVDKEMDRVLPGLRDRNVVNRPNLAVLKHTKCPAILVEVGFISNPGDEAKLHQPATKEKTAQAITAAAVKYLSA